jgi:hypothetical protein
MKKNFLSLLAGIAAVFVLNIFLYQSGIDSGFIRPASGTGSGTGIILTISSSGPASTNYNVNQSDFEVFDLTFETTEDITISQLKFNLTATGEGLLYQGGSGTGRSYSNAEIIKISDGSTIFGPVNYSLSGSDSTQVITFSGSWSLPAGSSIDTKLIVDVANKSTISGDTLRSNLRAPNTIATFDSTGFPLINTVHIFPTIGPSSNTHTCL